jgi:hypothetical protein
MKTENELREELFWLVQDYWTHSRSDDPQIVALSMGIARVFDVIGEAQGRRGEWASMRARLREGIDAIDHALDQTRAVDPRLRKVAGWAKSFGDLVLRFLDEKAPQ